jgi:hypothetical protein
MNFIDFSANFFKPFLKNKIDPFHLNRNEIFVRRATDDNYVAGSNPAVGAGDWSFG